MAEMSPEDWERVLEINATGAYRCMREVLPSMRERRDGLVVNISSVAGKRAITLGGVVYCASKFAMTALGTAVSNEVRNEGVRITNVYPGEVNTPILENRPTPVSQEHKESILQPEDIASLIVTICALPPRANVPEIVIKPTIQEWV
jgi:NADP-dependent 3-hydroxy acid dehydrogenase YdfG